VKLKSTGMDAAIIAGKSSMIFWTTLRLKALLAMALAQFSGGRSGRSWSGRNSMGTSFSLLLACVMALARGTRE